MKITMIISYTAIIITIILIVVFSYLKFAIPDVGKAENIKVEITPQRIARGDYLCNSVCACTDCHSTRDWNRLAAPIVPNTLGMGGEAFDKQHGFNGNFYARNITPFALGDWTDGEIIRALACGVSKKGEALITEMPYLTYGTLDKEDIYSLVAYLRTMPSVKNVVPKAQPDFPMNLIMNTKPKRAHFKTRPDTSNKAEYGKYLFTAATCSSCHTRQKNGKPIHGMELAGGMQFNLSSGGTVYSSNITPDLETGIGRWTEEMFVRRFKAFTDSSFKPSEVKHGEFNTIMPWLWFSKMTTRDLKAIYAYLRTVKPVKNKVTRFVPEG